MSMRAKSASEKDPFDGEWTYEARVDGTLVASSKFHVHCP
jgi:hypothetical protein